MYDNKDYVLVHVPPPFRPRQPDAKTAGVGLWTLDIHWTSLLAVSISLRLKLVTLPSQHAALTPNDAFLTWVLWEDIQCSERVPP